MSEENLNILARAIKKNFEELNAGGQMIVVVADPEAEVVQVLANDLIGDKFKQLLTIISNFVYEDCVSHTRTKL